MSELASSGRRVRAIAAGAFAGVALLTSSVSGQTLLVGVGAGGPFNRGAINAPGLRTTVQFRPAVNLEGDATSATFGWSATPCPLAVKIKFFRPQAPPDPFAVFNFLEERGPFDVTAPLDPPASGIASQTVALSPPVHLQAGGVIAIANFTSCGAPVYSGTTFTVPPPPPPSSVSVPGDVKTSIVTASGTIDGAVFVIATGPSPLLGLLGDRFAISMRATNPRNGATATGAPVRLANGAGYFALPGLTGDATFPEVTVKMTDATGVPSLGGTFWFFHAPLTDVDYVLDGHGPAETRHAHVREHAIRVRRAVRRRRHERVFSLTRQSRARQRATAGCLRATG